MAPTDEPPVESASSAPAPAKPAPFWRRAFWKDWKAPAVATGVAALILGFGGGYVTAGGMPAFFGGKGGAEGSTASAPEPTGPKWSLFGKPRDAGAPRRGVPKPEGFAVWKTRLDTSRSEPLACIEMSKPLDPSKAYADFVLISPDTGGTPAVSVNSRNKAELCIGGLGLTERRVTLLKGLPGAGGQTLAANADVDFTFGEKPPYVGFAGDGVILPREDADGVGIETVNVSRLQIEVWRVSDRNLVRKSISAPEPTGEGQWPSDYGDDSPDDEGRVVWKGDVAVRGGQGERVTTVFPLGAVLKEMSPGGYVIKVRDASSGVKSDDDDSGEGTQPAQARRWIVFTDMAMIAYDGAESLDVVVRSLKTAKIQAGVRVALVARNGEDLAEAKTDGSGKVRFPRPLLQGEGAMRPKMVMAYGPQGDLAVLDLDRSPVDLSKQGMGGRNAPGGEDVDETGGRKLDSDIDGYLYADRGIYRPGETVHLAALIRDRASKAVKDRKGVIVVKRPSGVEFKRIAFDNAPTGAVTSDVVLPKSAPRGRWKASLQIEGIKDPVGEMAFSVEDFAPQRLAVDTEGRKDTPVAAGETRSVAVTARFLYGAAGAGLQTQGEARVMADPNPFPAYKDYQWGDQQTAFPEKFMELGTSVTDGEGKATLSLATNDLPETSAPLKATVTASVFEPGGRPVRESLFLKVRTKPLYLGVKVDQGDATGGDAAPVSLDVIAVDSLGKRVAAPGATYTLISENWNYDWFQQDGRWQWRRTSRDVIVQRGALNIGAGSSAKVSRKLGWGDYRMVVEAPNGVKSVIRFAAGWGAPAKDAEAPDFVRITAGDKPVGQGDSVTLTIKAPYAGEAQVAVATDRVIDFKTFSVGEKGGSVTLKTSAAWGGGAYVLVSVIQPRDPTATPKPRRALGLLYVPLDPKGRKLTVELGTPAKLNSREAVEVPVAVKGLGLGQRAKVTIAAVDEGILRLTKFDSPDPAKWYFGKRALTLDYRDDYGRLLDPNLGAPANVNFGADQLGGEGLTVTPIKSVALWSGVVETGIDGKAKIKLPAAEFNGELRVMAVAWTDEAVGSASKPMTVREAVVADLNLPRFLAPGDKPVATLELHNVEGAAGGYQVETSSTNGLQMTLKKLFQLVLGQRIAERIPFLAPTRTGIGEVGFKVTGPNNFATAKTYPLQTRIGWSPITRTTVELQKPGESYTPPASLLSGLAAGDVSLHVSYSPFKGFDPAPIAVSLSRYPYGCTEQVISVAYPLLFANELAPDPKRRSSSAALNDAVGRLLDRQTLDGAFGLWRVGDGEADAWLGAYATDFLWEAKVRGAPVPDAALDRALAAMRQISRPEGWANVSYRLEYPEWWGRNGDESKAATKRMRSRASAYALYVLAKAGRGDLARLRWWHDVHMKESNDPLAKAQVGAGLALMGDKARARSALRKAVASLGHRDDADWYQSPLRDTAGIIALAYEAGEVDIARDLQKRLEGAVRDPDSLNTQEQARLLQAASFMLKAAGTMKIDATGANAIPTAGQMRWSVGKLADARFVNRGGGALWRTVTVRGTTIAAPMGESNGVSVGKRFFTMTGGGVDPSALNQGDRVIVLVSGRSAQGRTLPLVIDDALPAGWEIETTLSPEDAKEGPFKFLGELSGVDVQEARDDRYIAAMDLAGNKTFAVAYVARAVTPGDFFLPAPEVRDMYRPSVNARGSAGRTIIAAGS
ncbi:alpha-2-macroglobulin family protein [Caulobacter mirabilis]|uniref:Alpha-2-macroglobulin n=1 Tax=Caulobacter mirabilis TaxID=69666 RepID=A0A2D2ASX5_9CAUL|nr:alpha-2-macroglobulin [Caulobacter mirabilis]ATQ41112.1 alpha-2-macroglobulin [Caulobacter mirabilis]